MGLGYINYGGYKMIRKVLVLCVSLIFTVGEFANAKSYTGLKNIDSNDCLEYFEKGKVIHKYAIFGDESDKQKVAFVYDEELFEMIFYPKEQTIKDKIYAFQFICNKLTD